MRALGQLGRQIRGAQSFGIENLEGLWRFRIDHLVEVINLEGLGGDELTVWADCVGRVNLRDLPEHRLDGVIGAHGGQNLLEGGLAGFIVRKEIEPKHLEVLATFSLHLFPLPPQGDLGELFPSHQAIASGLGLPFDLSVLSHGSHDLPLLGCHDERHCGDQEAGQKVGARDVVGLVHLKSPQNVVDLQTVDLLLEVLLQVLSGEPNENLDGITDADQVGSRNLLHGGRENLNLPERELLEVALVSAQRALGRLAVLLDQNILVNHELVRL